jgi:hypothetical protein
VTVAALTLHPYICEGCTTGVPLTEAQYREEIFKYRRILCDDCWEKQPPRRRKKLSRRATRGPDSPASDTGGGEEAHSDGS